LGLIKNAHEQLMSTCQNEQAINGSGKTKEKHIEKKIRA
jgi:hypothetical protein